MKKILLHLALMLCIFGYVFAYPPRSNSLTIVDGKTIFFDAKSQFCDWYIQDKRFITNVSNNKNLLDILQEHEAYCDDSPLEFVIKMLNIQTANGIQTKEEIVDYLYHHANNTSRGLKHYHPEITRNLILKLLDKPESFKTITFNFHRNKIPILLIDENHKHFKVPVSLATIKTPNGFSTILQINSFYGLRRDFPL